MVRCVETGRGSKGSVFVCDVEGVGDIIIRALKVAPYKYRLAVENRRHRHLLPITILARNRSTLRRRIEEYLRAYVEKYLNFETK